MKINYSADFKPEEIKEQVGEIDKKIDKLETKIEDFREVVTKTSPKK